MGFLIKPFGCIFVLVLFPLSIPILLFYAAFKLLTFALRDSEMIKPNHSHRATRYRRDVRRSDKRRSSPFDGLFRGNEPMERKMKRHAQQLSAEVNEALQYNQRIPTEKKSYLKAQTAQTTEYVLVSVEKLARIRRRKAIIGAKRRVELQQLESRLIVEVKRSLDMLEDALVSIIRVDVVGGNATIDRLVTDLNESNARLRDIADAHEEIRTVREAWVGELE